MAPPPRHPIHELQGLEFFRDWTDDELEHLLRVAERVSYGAGEHLIREGRTGMEFMVILEGEADVMRQGELLARLGPGDHLGEMALLDGARTTASVVARGPVTALGVSNRDFRSLLETVPSLDRRLLISLTRRLRRGG